MAALSKSSAFWARKIITEPSVGSACHQPP